jgi:hypothetical protein
MRNTVRSTLTLALACASVALGCTAGPDLLSSDSNAAHTSAALSGSAGACAPSVTVSTSSCSVTVNGTACDCTDGACITSAIESCIGEDGGLYGYALSDASLPISLPPVPSLPSDDGGLLPPGCDYDASAIGSGFGGNNPPNGTAGGGSLDDAGSSSACSASAIDSAKTQFCNDVDSWLASHGSSATLDCSQVGSDSYPTSCPTSWPSTSLNCSEATSGAMQATMTTLSGCSPATYIGWDTSAQLQLFESGACEP